MQIPQQLRLSLNTYQNVYPKNRPLKIACSRPQAFVQYKAVPSVYNKNTSNGPPLPRLEANMNYVPTGPPSPMKQSNKIASVKFHIELLLTTTTRKQSRSGATPFVLFDASTSPSFGRLWNFELIK